MRKEELTKKAKDIFEKINIPTKSSVNNIKERIEKRDKKIGKGK